VRRPRRVSELAPRDSLVREIQRVLDLIKPHWGPDNDTGYDGYCGEAAEAYLHLAGGRQSGLRVMRHGRPDGGSHWWLEDSSGRVIDLTLSAQDHRWLKQNPRDSYRYDLGRGAMFRNGYSQPSKRAAAIIELVESRR
jgi:hypothetical protein